MEPTPGLLVHDRVRLIEPIAGGAMGSVWLAEHLTLGTRVAVKFLRHGIVRRSEAEQRFQREAALAAKIKSPYVVQIHDHGTTADGAGFIVMELLDGESLGARIERDGPLDCALVGRVVAQVARALGSAHQLGIVHRDIKPDNVFLTQADGDLVCKVLDFGIAKHTRAPDMRGPTSEGAMLGTPEFMSPEQVMSSRDVDAQADLWALAAVAYCALTNEIPFEGDGVGQLVVQILNAEFRPPTELRSELPLALDAWFARAFHAEVARRFASARELAETFERAVTGNENWLGAVESRGPRSASGHAPLRGAGPIGPARALSRPADDSLTLAGASSDAPSSKASRRRGRYAILAVGVALAGAAVVVLGGARSPFGSADKIETFLTRELQPTPTSPPPEVRASPASEAPPGTESQPSATFSATSPGTPTTAAPRAGKKRWHDPGF